MVEAFQTMVSDVGSEKLFPVKRSLKRHWIGQKGSLRLVFFIPGFLYLGHEEKSLISKSSLNQLLLFL